MVPAGQVTSLETNKTGVNSGIQAVGDTKAAYHAAAQWRSRFFDLASAEQAPPRRVSE